MLRPLPLLVCGLLLASATALADQGGGNGHGRGRGESAAPLGSFVVENDSRSVVGEHLSFNFSDAGITDFAAEGTTLFDLAVQGGAVHDERAEDGPRAARAQAQGSMFRVRTANFTFQANDNPSAVGRLVTNGGHVDVTFARPATLVARTNESVGFTVGELHGTLRGANLTLDGRVVGVDGEMLVFLDTARGSFDQHRGDIGEAIERRHVGIEATFNAQNADHVQEDVVSYGNVTMTTLKAERGNLTVQVEGHGFEGRVIVLNVDGRMLGADRADKLDVTLDNASIAPATDLADILDPDDDGFSPEYYVVYDPAAEAFQLIVTVPHYSVHTLSVTTLLDVLKPSVVVGVLAGVALLVPAGMVLFRRK
ncbi:MAG TPA: hypothetical protein VM370_08535 [Candidatus Thermoplasmatota archaeon]|nr:hypothetical protein [Candidatus Thermoplasmatota archaeon]